MGSSKKVTVGYWYKLLYHAGLSKGPIDAFLEFRGGDKTAWKGGLTASGTININQPKLWGGEKDQGGIVSDVDVMFGESTQAANAYLLANLGAQVPAWRGLASLVFKGGKYGAMNPYPQKASYKIRRILQGWDGGAAWYPETAEIVLDQGLEVAESAVWDYVLSAQESEPGYSNFSPPGSGWAPAAGPFGHGGPDNNGLWPNATTLWLRKALDLGVGRHTQIAITVKNGCLVLVGGVVVAEKNRDNIQGENGAVVADIPFSGLKTIYIKAFNRAPLDGQTFLSVSIAQDSLRAMNPAHILYYARTNSDLGREPIANINDVSLRAAADTLYAEGFGICTTHDPGQESVEEFEARIAKLIDGSFSRDPITGLWHLDLSRGDYVLGDLPILTDDDILEFRELPSTLDNAINSVSVTYFDPERKESITTPPVQARGLIQDFGTIHQTIEYPEIPTASLAARVALRELRATATPTRAFDLVCTRKPYAWRPNTYFRLQLPRRGIADMVCIVGEKESGSLKSGAIRLKAAQDIYSMPAFSFVEVEPGVDTTPSQTPVAITLQAAFEAPYIELVSTLSRADMDVLPADAGYLIAVAADPATSRDYTLMVDAGGGYLETGNGDWCPTATVVAASSWLDTAFTLSGGTRLDEVVVGSAALWDNEIVRVDAINPTTGAITLGRACADTLPQQHAAGSRLWFYQDSDAVDLTEYASGESLNVKLLTNTSGQQLGIAAAFAIPVGILGRAVLPYPPAKITINGVYYPTADLIPTDSIVVAYAHRDRLLQADQIVDWLQASIGPEPGVTYSGVLGVVDGGVVETITGVTAASMTFAAPLLFDTDLYIEIWSVRGAYGSLHWIYPVHTAAGAPLRWSINRSYSYQVTPAGGTGPYTYAVLSGALPTGLSLNTSTGVISGTPSVAGDATFTIRITDSLAAIEDQSFIYTTEADPQWANVVALLPMDGADGSTTFTDLTGKRTVTVGGSAQIDTAQSVFGGASGLFAKGTQDYLRFDAHTDWQFGAGDFTVDFRIRKSANSANGSYIFLFAMRDGGFSGFVLADNRNTSGQMTFLASSNGTSWNLVNDAAIGTLALNTWGRISIQRSGVNLRVYKDDVQIGTWNIGSAALAWNAAWQPVLGGISGGSNQSMSGWLEEFRATKGVARGAPTVDDIPFPAG